MSRHLTESCDRCRRNGALRYTIPTMVSVRPNRTAKYDCDQSLTPQSRCQAHLARRAKPPTRAKAPNTRLSAMNARATEPDDGTGLSTVTSNDELERPVATAGRAPRAQNDHALAGQPDHVSRPLQALVRPSGFHPSPTYPRHIHDNNEREECSVAIEAQ
jgi:hypothetical protein